MSTSPRFSVLSSRWFLGLLIVLTIALGFAVTREFVRTALVRETIAQLEAEQRRLEGERQSLVRYQAYLSTEASIESEARETFGLAEPGETQVIFPAATDAESATSELPFFAPITWWSWYLFDPKRYREEENLRHESRDLPSLLRVHHEG